MDGSRTGTQSHYAGNTQIRLKPMLKLIDIRTEGYNPLRFERLVDPVLFRTAHVNVR